MSKMLQTATSPFVRFTDLYLPADDSSVAWIKEHFNGRNIPPSFTRKHFLWMGPHKENLVNCNFITDEYIPGETYEMFSVRFETDCIEALYERLSKAGIALEPMRNMDQEGNSFVFTDPYGNKFQVWQHPDTKPQPLRDGVHALIGVTALFFPVANPEETRKWYTEVIGLELNDLGWPVTGNGQELRFYKALDSGQNQLYHRICAIANMTVNHLDEMHHQMLEQGQKVENIFDRGGCGRQFQLYDPDGNILTIWEPQTLMLKKFKFDSAEYQWKQKYELVNAALESYEGDIDSFLARVTTSELMHRRIVIPGYNILQKLDPEGMESLLETLHQYSLEHPEHPFEIIKRDWYPTDDMPLEPTADNRQAYIYPLERALGVIKIFGRPKFKDSPNWKDRIALEIPYFYFDMDTFFTKALEGRHEIFRQLQIIHDEAFVPWYLTKIDPDAAREVKLAVEQFNQEHPEHAIELIE